MLLDLFQFILVLIPLISLYARNVLYHGAGVVWGLTVTAQAFDGIMYTNDKKRSSSLLGRGIVFIGTVAFHMRGLLQILSGPAKMLIVYTKGNIVMCIEIVQHIGAAALYIYSSHRGAPDPKWVGRLKNNVWMWQGLRNAVAVVYFSYTWRRLYSECELLECISAPQTWDTDMLVDALNFTWLSSAEGSKAFWAVAGAVVELIVVDPFSFTPISLLQRRYGNAQWAVGICVILFSLINLEVATGAWMRP